MPAGGQAQVLNPEGGFGVIVSHIVLAYDVHVCVPLLDGDNYGQQEATDAWVLLEEEKE